MIADQYHYRKICSRHFLPYCIKTINHWLLLPHSNRDQTRMSLERSLHLNSKAISCFCWGICVRMFFPTIRTKLSAQCMAYMRLGHFSKMFWNNETCLTMHGYAACDYFCYLLPNTESSSDELHDDMLKKFCPLPAIGKGRIKTHSRFRQTFFKSF